MTLPYIIMAGKKDDEFGNEDYIVCRFSSLQEAEVELRRCCEDENSDEECWLVVEDYV
jgi:hypothetical protein